MTREEEIIEASQLYAKAQQKSFVDGAMWSDKHPTEEVQRLKRTFEGDPDAYEQGKKDAFKMAYKWLIERYDNQGVILIDDIHELYEKMEE